MAKNQTKPKDLFYRRAKWANVTNSLEGLIVDAHNQLKTRGERSFVLDSGSTLVGARIEANEYGVFLQIASYIPNQATSTIDKQLSVPNATIEAEPAPEGKDFLDGDIFVMVKDNHVLLCPSGLRESKSIIYFKRILKKAFSSIGVENLELSKIADANKISMIKKEGVKELRLSSSLYHASVIKMEKTTNSTSGFLGAISNQFNRIFSNDPTLKDISDLENLDVEVTIRFDGAEGRKKHQPEGFGEHGRERLLKTAEILLNEEEDEEEGFIIVTGRNNKITSGQIRVSERSNIRTYGKSLSYQDAWIALRDYYLKLKGTGVLSQ